MKRFIIHYYVPHLVQMMGSCISTKAACGQNVKSLTMYKELVNCKNCKRTHWFKNKN